ncbi:MAG: dehydrogenase [Cytophagaceae bacterium]|nr:dehydrogenase [Cytophagaceae bacterium]|tara:strand:+ start:503 stop:1651 length:1149 start_codon:yes stop_codon:yes gene_type:complete
MKNIRVGVAGMGFIGPVHIEALRRNPGIEVVSILHPDPAEAKAKAESLSIEKYYTDFDELIANDNLDSVHICTPNFLHYEMAKKALEAGLHVVCEKPLSTTIEEAQALVALAKEKGLANCVHFNLRYYPAVRQMKRMRETGELGNIYSIIGSYLQDWLFYETDYNWRLEPSQSGESRAVADIGSHLIDLLEYVTGLKITAVFADFNTVHETRKKPLKPIETYSGKMLKPEDYADMEITTEDYASILLRFDNGNKGVVTVSQVAAGRKNQLKIEIAGSNETVMFNSESPNALWVGHRDRPNQELMRDPALFDAEAAKIINYPGGHNEGFPDTSKQLFKEFYAAVREGKQPEKPSFPTFADGLRELILCERIIESQREEKWVKA